MKRHGEVPLRAIAQAIAKAKALVHGHCDLAVPPGQRLLQIAKSLKVSRIECGAIETSGFLARQPDGNYAVYYADERIERRRFTVAHEFAHLILDRYYKHLRTNDPRTRLANRDSGGGADKSGPDVGIPFVGHSPGVERAVDRIAAELLMPERLLVSAMKDACKIEKIPQSSIVNKREVVRAVAQTLGVSECALVLRLHDIDEIQVVRLIFQLPKENERRFRWRVGVTHSRGMQVQSYPNPSLSDLRGKNNWELIVPARTAWGCRKLRCHGWKRPSHAGDHSWQVSWVIGWTWNVRSIPEWDDSKTVEGE